jgi:dihydroorotate dehydrogenase electron transfer subunit
MSNKIHTLKVVETNKLASDIYEIILENPKTNTIRPCQFYNLGLKNQGTPILKRPISVSQVSSKGIHFVIKKLGAGTERLCNLVRGDEVMAVGPLGNGFNIEENLQTKKLLVIGGGIGTAPLLELVKEAKQAGKEVIAVLGYLNEAYLIENFKESTQKLRLCSMSNLINSDEINQIDEIDQFIGNALEGTLDLELDLNKYTIVACGPDIMLHKIKDAFEDKAKDLYLVTEERMACGMGACLVCAKKIIQNDEEKMARTCIEGPVFLGREVQF